MEIMCKEWDRTASVSTHWQNATLPDALHPKTINFFILQFYYLNPVDSLRDAPYRDDYIVQTLTLCASF